MKRIFWIGSFSENTFSVGDYAQTIAIRNWFIDNYSDYEIICYNRQQFIQHWKKLYDTIDKEDYNLWDKLLWQDTSVAMMNMMLMAEVLELKTCWLSIIPENENTIRKILSIPERYALTCFLMLGYSNMKIDMNTYTHWNKLLYRDKNKMILEGK